MICIATEVYHSDRQLSIMQILNGTTTAATAVQNPSVMKARHKKGTNYRVHRFRPSRPK